MIVDHLQNIDFYKKISPVIKSCLDYIIVIQPDIALGDYWVTKDIKVTVMEYMTKEKFDHGYEAHRKYVDVQYCISGKEKINWSPLFKMSNHTPYDESKDRAFYNNPSQDSFVVIGDGVFAIFFPEDAHGPQQFVSRPELIKKIVIKVPVDLF